MDVQAALYRAGAETLSLETLQLDEPRADEILVRLVASGICHADQSARERGRIPTPIVLGHEGSGVVEQVGSAVTGFESGDHVVMTFDSCGHCGPCRNNLPSYCLELMRRSFGGRRPDGSVTLHQGEHPVHGSFFGQSSFATYSLCTARNAVKVRRDAPLELLGPLGCGVQTGAGAVINSLAIRPGQSIAVFGAGAVGLSAIMAARLVGAAHIIAFDRVDSRLQLARDMGATHAANPSQGSVADTLRQVTGGGVDFAFDTTGAVPVMQQAIAGLGVRGTFAYVANTKAMEPLPVALAPLMARGGTIRGVMQGDSDPQRFIPLLLDYYMEGRFPFDRMVKFYAFDQINEAIEASRQGSTIKPILRMGG